jgi:hypothetical protein
MRWLNFCINSFCLAELQGDGPKKITFGGAMNQVCEDRETMEMLRDLLVKCKHELRAGKSKMVCRVYLPRTVGVSSFLCQADKLELLFRLYLRLLLIEPSALTMAEVAATRNLSSDAIAA